jgi:hypothetical protein
METVIAVRKRVGEYSELRFQGKADVITFMTRIGNDTADIRVQIGYIEDDKGRTVDDIWLKSNRQLAMWENTLCSFPLISLVRDFTEGVFEDANRGDRKKVNENITRSIKAHCKAKNIKGVF